MSSLDPNNLASDCKPQWQHFQGTRIKPLIVAYLEKQAAEAASKLENCSLEEVREAQGQIRAYKRVQKFITTEFPDSYLKEISEFLKRKD